MIKRTKKELIKGAVQTLVICAVLFAGFEYFKSRYIIGVPGQKANCLEWNYFIVDTKNKNYKKSGLVAFKSKGLDPFFEDGELFIKEVAAVQGDVVKVGQTTYINDLPRNTKLDLLDKLKKQTKDYERVITIKNGELFGMGTKPKSFDSRYWGTIKDDQIIGVAYAIY